MNEKTTDSAASALSAGLCGCRQCLRDRDVRANGFPIEACLMILCETCGNKRCPHATDHRNACTGSNAPGQPGSAYGGLDPHNDRVQAGEASPATTG